MILSFLVLTTLSASEKNIHLYFMLIWLQIAGFLTRRHQACYKIFFSCDNPKSTFSAAFFYSSTTYLMRQSVKELNWLMPRILNNLVFRRRLHAAYITLLSSSNLTTMWVLERTFQVYSSLTVLQHL